MTQQWPFDKITSHEVDAVGRFTSQYFDATKLQALARIWARRIQAIEGAAETVLKDRWVPDAAGVQLDELGAIVGESRLGRSDEAYREAINIRITINRSGGEPERIIEYLRRITGATAVLYGEIYPANIEIYIQNELTQSQIDSIKDLTPAAVGGIYVSTSGDEIPYGHNELTVASYTDRDGFGELVVDELELDTGDTLELSDGSTLGFTDQQEDPNVGDGGVLAELFEV